MDGMQRPLMDELHALCAPAIGSTLRAGYCGRKEVVDALLAEGLVKHLLCLRQRAIVHGFGEFRRKPCTTRSVRLTATPSGVVYLLGGVDV